MSCRYQDLRNKEVINVCDGRRLGCICDVIINVCTCSIEAIVVPGGCGGILGWFNFGKEIVIPWCRIKKFGDDVVLVDVNDLSVKRDNYT